MLFLDDVQSVVECIQRGTGRDAGRFIALEHSELNRGKPGQWPGQPLEYLIYPVLDQVRTLAAPQSMLTHCRGIIPPEPPRRAAWHRMELLSDSAGLPQ